MLGDDEPHDDVALLAFQLTPLPMHGFTLTLPAEPEAVPSVRRALERWLGEGDTAGAEAYAIKVACGEACSNAIEHAYRPGDAAFQVDAKRQGQEIAVAIRDFGQWRDKREDDRGRGLLLMETLMDSVEIDPSAEGTTVRMRRRLGSA